MNIIYRSLEPIYSAKGIVASWCKPSFQGDNTEKVES